MKIQWFLIIAILFSAANNTYCQEFMMLHYTKDDGLPSNTVYNVYRDSKGFLWFATDHGIARYNGVRFEVFTSQDGLSDNEVFFFQEDYDGRLWLGTYNGQLCYFQNDTFHTAKNTPWLNQKLKTSHIGEIIIEKDSSITFFPFDYTEFFNIKGQRIKKYYINRGFVASLNNAYNGPLHKKKLANDSFYVYGRFSDFIIDSNSNVCKIIKRKVDPFFSFAFSQNEGYFVTSEYLCDVNEKPILKFNDNFRKKNHLFNVFSDAQNYFFCTNDGLYINNNILLLRGIEVSCVTQDDYGNYWIATLNKGIYHIKKNFLNTRLYANQYKYDVKYCSAVHNNIFYANANNNLYRFFNGRTINTFNGEEGKRDKKSYMRYENPGFFIDDSYHYYNFYGEKYIYINNILSHKLEIKKYHYVRDAIKGLFISKGKIVIENVKNIVGIDYTIGKKQIIWQNYCDSLNTSRIFCAAQDAAGDLWYSTIDKVFRIENAKSVPQPQFQNIAFKSFCFYQKYLLGYTFDNVLLVCRNIEGPVHIDTLHSAGCIWSKFFTIDSSHILVSTDNYYRLITVSQQGNEKAFNISVIEDPFIPVCESICTDSSNCYFFKDGSITSIRIKELFVHNDPPAIFFRILRSNKKSYTIDSFMEVPYDEARNIRISFIPLSFGGKNVTYQYAISGSGNDNWKDIKGEEINMVQPGYGDYVIKVRTKTISSLYSKPAVFTLHILKPFWAAWWFITLSGCLFIILVGIIVRYRIVYIVRKKEKLHESEIKLMKLEYKALNALMNPHFIFNALNNMQSLINKNEKRAANKYLGIFAKLIRQNMHNIALELIPLNKEMEIVADYLTLEKLRFKELLNYQITIDEKVDMAEIMVPPLLVQPLVENAIKHGIFPRKSTDSFVGIEIFVRNNFVVISVKDNGIGIEEAQKRAGKTHQSFGLENIRKRIAQLAVIQNKQIMLGINDERDDTGKLLWTIVSISISLL